MRPSDMAIKDDIVYADKLHILYDFSSPSNFRQFKITAGATDEEQGFGGDNSLYIERPGNVFYVNHAQFIDVFAAVGALHEDRVVIEETFPNVCPQLMQTMVEYAMMYTQFTCRIARLFPFGYRLSAFIELCDKYGDTLLDRLKDQTKQYDTLVTLLGHLPKFQINIGHAITTMILKFAGIIDVTVTPVKTEKGFKIDFGNSRAKYIIDNINDLPPFRAEITQSRYEFTGASLETSRTAVKILQM